MSDVVEFGVECNIYHEGNRRLAKNNQQKAGLGQVTDKECGKKRSK
jgi:hypothetical protein